jgi:hypothetical protein
VAGTLVWNGWDTCVEWLGHVLGMAGTRVWNGWDSAWNDWDTCLEWLGHVFGMQELDPCRELTVLTPEDTRRMAQPTLRWLELVEENLKNVRIWRGNWQD